MPNKVRYFIISYGEHWLTIRVVLAIPDFQSLPIYNGSDVFATHSSSELRPRDGVKDLRILPLGASITNGYKSSSGNGYRKPLRDQLRFMGYEVDMIGSLKTGTMKDNVRLTPSVESFIRRRLEILPSRMNSMLRLKLSFSLFCTCFPPR